jgi:hypothetical protein
MANDLVTVWGGVPRIGRAPASNELLIGNGSGFTLQTVAITLDNILGSTQGSIAYRSATQWTQLTPSTSGFLLQTNGASNNPSWVSLGTAFNNYFGTTTGAFPVYTGSTWGTLSPGPSGTIVVSDGSTPVYTTLTNLFDATLTTQRQALITRGASQWTFLSPTTTPYLLLTNNTGNASSDVGWTTFSNAIDNGTSGTTFLGSMLYAASGGWQKLNIGAANTILTSSGATAPAWSTTTSNLDATMGNTVGGVLYRNSSGVWANSGVGNPGQILQTNGSGANPSWVNQWITLYKTSGQNITSTSYTDDTALQFTVANGQTFIVEASISYNTGAGGALLAVNGPASALQFTVPSGPSTTAVNTSISGVSIASAGNFGILIFGIFQANAAGTFAIRHALNSASGTTVIQAGSWLKYYLL